LTTKVVTTPNVYMVDAIFPTFHTPWDGALETKSVHDTQEML